MSTVNVSNLPVIDELFEADMILVQAKDRTGLLKFSDLVVGEQQVTFYNEVVNARNSISIISQTAVDNTTAIEEQASSISDIQAKNTAQGLELAGLTTTITSLTEENINLKSTITALEGAVETQLEQTSIAIAKMDQAIAANSSLQQSLTAVNTNVMTMTQRVDNLQASINSTGAIIYQLTGRVDALEVFHPG
jgi:chromosome segregation ATPase